MLVDLDTRTEAETRPTVEFPVPHGPDARGTHFIRIFRACCLVVGIHVVVDAYIHLRPGTSPLDHLVSGTVPVAALGVLCAVVGRLRTGGAATLALVLGAAIVIGGTGAPGSALVGGRVDLKTVTGGLGSGPLSGDPARAAP